MVIWKYDLEITPIQIIELPKGFQVLQIQEQDSIPTFWAIVNPEQKDKSRLEVVMLMTGEKFSEPTEDFHYFGTCQVDGFVAHYFARLLE